MPIATRQAPAMRVKLAAWAIVLVAALAVAEIAARVIFPMPQIANLDRATYSPQFISDLLLRDRESLAHAAFRYESAPDGAASVHELNLYGFRDDEWTIAKGRAHRVLFVGDSMVEGFLAGGDETIPRVFARLARARENDLQVWNLGIGGAGLANYVSLIQDAVPAFAADEVILVLHANDFTGDPVFAAKLIKAPFVAHRANPWVPRLVSTAERALRGEAVPRAWHGKPFAFFAAVPSPANPWTRYGATYEKYVAPDIASAMREGRFNPFVAGEVQNYEHGLTRRVDVVPWFAFMSEFLGRRGVRLRVAYIPQPAQVTDYYLRFKQRFCPPDAPSLTGERYQVQAATAAAAARSLGIDFLDLTPAIRDAEAHGQHLYWHYDEHLRPSGYAFVANAIYVWRSGLKPSG